MLNDYAYTLKILRSSAGAIMCGFIAYFFATEYGSGLESSTQYGLSFLAGMAWVLAEIVDTTVNNGVRKHRKFNHIDKVYIKTHNYNGIGIGVPSEKTVERVNKKIDSRESKLVFINSLPISFGLPIAAAIAFTGYVRDIVPPNSDNFLTAIFLVSASVAVSIPYLLAVLTDMKLSSSIINATNSESEGEKTYYIFENETLSPYVARFVFPDAGFLKRSEVEKRLNFMLNSERGFETSVILEALHRAYNVGGSELAFDKAEKELLISLGEIYREIKENEITLEEIHALEEKEALSFADEQVADIANTAKSIVGANIN